MMMTIIIIFFFFFLALRDTQMMIMMMMMVIIIIIIIIIFFFFFLALRTLTGLLYGLLPFIPIRKCFPPICSSSFPSNCPNPCPPSRSL
jgi:hypothetical protein